MGDEEGEGGRGGEPLQVSGVERVQVEVQEEGVGLRGGLEGKEERAVEGQDAGAGVQRGGGAGVVGPAEVRGEGRGAEGGGPTVVRWGQREVCLGGVDQ